MLRFVDQYRIRHGRVGTRRLVPLIETEFGVRLQPRGLEKALWHETAIYDRTALAPGATIEGPAIIEQLDTTIPVEPGVVAEVDGFGNLLIPVAQGDERAAGDAVDSAADPVTDAITLAVVQNGLGQIASEMDLVHQETSFSPVISEAFDRANGIYDRNDGKIISPSEYISPPSTSQRAR